MTDVTELIPRESMTQLFEQIIAGAKGGESKPKPAVEAPDSLQSTAYANILDLVSEGEVYGLVDGLRSITLDETPLQNADGTINFPGVTVETRNGSQDQAYIPGFPAVDSEIAVGVELRFGTPWVRAVNNLELSAVRIRLSVPRLQSQDTSNGNTNGYRVVYAIDVATDGGAYQEVISTAFDGKTTTKYERTHRINLPPATAGWSVRVRRLTPNATTSNIIDTTNIDAITEVIDAKLRYPNSALVGLKFDASQFSSIPTRSFHMRGRIIRVPSNYNPDNRTYIGVWDGTFKPAYTNNPAWIYYDMLMNDRFGLGHLLNALQVDRWELYRIGQFCDQLVPDGKGGQEPRFTCNVYLQGRADALKVMQDLAGVFRGMSYWGAGQVLAVADMPEDPVYTYTNANVIDGKFGYSGTTRKARFNVALVSWNDPTDFYRAKVEYVDDRDGIVRYGVQQTEISAFGCTSQGQAQRMGKWALLSAKLETETVTFSTGLDGAIARPGQIIRIADTSRAGRRIGGRIRTASRTSVVLDAGVEIYPGDMLTIILPSGKSQTRKVKFASGMLTFDSAVLRFDSTAIRWDQTGFAQDVQEVEVTQAFDVAPVAQSIWAIESPTLAAQTFRVLNVAERFTDTAIAYEISAVKHVPGKYSNIDNGTKIDPPPITIIPPSVQAPVTDITLATRFLVDQGRAVTIMTIGWAPSPTAIAYEVEWRKNSGDWVYAGRTGTAAIEVSGIYAGRYVARVRAINAVDIGSVWAYSTEVQLDGKTTPPPVVTFLNAESQIFAVRVKWGFPADLSAEDVQRTEVMYGLTNDFSQATKLGDYAYPQSDMVLMNLSAGASFFFWARLVDRSGNVGAWTGPVNGQSSMDAGPILDYLSGKITESQLGQLLLEKIQTGEAAAVEVQKVVNELAAMYAIKTQLTVDGRTYMAGIGIGVENNGGIIESQVLVAASRFAVLDPNVAGRIVAPFVIQGGQVLINDAVIGTGRITNAMIGNFIQSNDYVAGQTGWRLDKSGVFEINGTIAGQGRLTITNRAIKVFDGNNVKRVQLGDLTA
ncbi:host specificity protein J [Pseudomonas koreensis]|uniref:host specificity protein J n=1 Tax=Pseudomonas koreensis TaxID=198620 RepID=UPI001FF09C96|nr:host specificity protein J [Pseudomonas koreensis]